MSQALFDRITEEIVSKMEAGAGNFTLPWRRSGEPLHLPRNACSDKQYRGGNVLVLWAAALGAGYSKGIWATYRQWLELGAQVRKGSHGTPIIFWQRGTAGNIEGEHNGVPPTAPRLVARCYTLFNAEQVDGFEAPPVAELAASERIARADAAFAATGASIAHGGDRAYYAPASDTVQMPRFEQFNSAEDYYAVLSHELVHWTGAEHRLDRKLSAQFGSEAYAMEELVALSGQSAPHPTLQ